MKEAKSNIDNNIDDIENDIEYVLKNVACLGKAARGEYNERMKQYLVLSIQKVIMQERIRTMQTMQTERAEAIACILDIAEQAKEADSSIDTVISAIKRLATHN